MHFIFIIFSLAFSLHTNSKETPNKQIPEVSANILSKMALKNSSKETKDLYVQYLMRSEHPKEYFQSFKDKKKRAQLQKKVEASLFAEITNLPEINKLSHSEFVKISKRNDAESTLQISNDIQFALKSISRNTKNIVGLPSKYTLLYANEELFVEFKIDNSLYEKYIKKTTNNHLSHLYLETQLLVGNYQNNNSFQVVIQEASLYTNKDKKVKLSVKTEKRTFAALTKKWLLSNGITQDLIGIHAFSIFGHRLHDTIKYNKRYESFCKKIKKIGKYQLVRCKKQYSNHAILETEFLDGKLSQLKLIAKPNIAKNEQDKILSKMSRSLKKPMAFFANEKKQWQAYGVNFTYNPMTLDQQTINTVIDNKITVFTMVSQKVLQILKENP